MKREKWFIGDVIRDKYDEPYLVTLTSGFGIQLISLKSGNRYSNYASKVLKTTTVTEDEILGCFGVFKDRQSVTRIGHISDWRF